MGLYGPGWLFDLIVFPALGIVGLIFCRLRVLKLRRDERRWQARERGWSETRNL